MNTDQIVAEAFYKELFARNLDRYKDTLNNLPVDNANPAYALLIKFYNSSNSQDKEFIVEFIKTIMADTASIILGSLDGVIDIDTLAGDFKVLYNNEEIQGDLQDCFLMKVQNN